MSNMVKIPFAISSGSAYSKKNNRSELLNLYTHIEEQGSKSNHILLNTSGTTERVELDFKIYGMYEFLGKVYIATSLKLYQYDRYTNAYKSVGNVNFSQKVVFSDNGIDLMVVGSNGYSYTPSTEIFKVMANEEGWYPSSTVAFMDGYFIFNREGTGQFFISELYSTIIDPIDWATGEAAPDDTVGVAVSLRQLWIIGERSTEVWYDSGDPDFPFTRISGAVSDIGCANNQTIAQIRDSIFFVGNDNKVYQTKGYTPIIVSTSAVDFNISKADRTTLEAFTYTENGHWFYVLTLGNEITFVYDIDTAQWHNRESVLLGKWMIDGAINFYDDGIAIGYGDKKIYDISIDTLTDNGQRIRREAVSLPINKTVNRIRIYEMQLDMEAGYDTEAEVILQLSEDSGKTWGNNKVATTGKKGQFKNRVRWLRLGQTRDAIVRIVTTDAIPIRINGLYARIT